ncbi:Type I restriction-modification system, specificity subunit S [Alloactinosynnema sp. L-07]|nr:Type I restriction-modification system, specificity subunit S [Alloactinosynnema sp. L-07]
MAQRAIAEVLGALDDKIVANDRLISAAEVSMITLAESTTRVVALGDIAAQSTASLKPEVFPSIVAHFSLPAFDDNGLPEVIDGALIKSNKFRLSRPCVLLSKLNPRIPRVWDVVDVNHVMSLASTEFVVLEPRNFSTSVLWALLRQSSFEVTLQGLVAGTSGSHQRVRPAEMLRIQVGDPASLGGRARSIVTHLGAVCHQHRLESARLAAARDELLPLLMSGKVRVRDAERLVEGVV